MAVTVKATLTGSLPHELLTEQDMRDVGALAVRMIRTRTEAGTDVNGASFRAYSAGYEKQKREALGHARVDLTVSGRMLNDMQVTEASKNSVSITFISQGGGSSGGTFIQRSRSMGAADKAAFNDPSRHFFGLNAENEAAIVAALDEALTRRINEGSQ